MCKTKPISAQPGPHEHLIVRNKPNFRQCRGGRDQRDVGRGQMRQTNPICPAGPGAWTVGCCTNKANFRRSEKKGKCFTGKDLWWIEHSIGPRKTKPIWGSPAGIRGVDYTEQSQLARREPWANRAKQTQFSPRCPVGRGPSSVGREANVQNKPNSAGSTVQNKPNFPSGARGTGPHEHGTRGTCAKRTQSPPVHRSAGVGAGHCPLGTGPAPRRSTLLIGGNGAMW